VGSYNGPVSYFLEISADGVRYILSHGLMTSLKTAWAIVNKEKSVEIPSKKCRPNFESSSPSTMEFPLIYERFYFESDTWNSELHKEAGFWECEGAFDLDEAEFRAKFADGKLIP